METTYQTSCSHCQAKLKCKESQLGQFVRCPRCKHEFTMQMPSPEPPPQKSVTDMADKIRVVCPHCSKALTVPSALIGRNGTCPACKSTISIEMPPPPKPSREDNAKRPAEVVVADLAQQPSHRHEFSYDGRRMLAAVSTAPDKYALVEPYLMQYEQPVAIAVQRQFPFSIFADIVLLSTHRLMVFKRFFTKIDMFDVNYVDFQDVKIKQGFFTSSLTITAGKRLCLVAGLVTEQALNIYRLCQDIETKARIARRQFQLEENRSRTTTMQINNLVAPPASFPQPQHQAPLLPNRDISGVGEEERNPFRLGE